MRIEQAEKRNGLRCGGLLLALLVNAGCAVGPEHAPPGTALPDRYRATEAVWLPAAEQVPEGNWWTLFQDARLDALLAEVDLSNQNLLAAEARYRRARASAQAARAGLFPVVEAALAERRGDGSNGGSMARHDLGLTLDWELDLWGRLRREAQAGAAEAEASAAELAAARLSVQAELALNYFQLRVADARLALLAETVVAYQRSLAITRNQYRVGVAGRVDVARAQTQLRGAEAQRHEVDVQRVQLEHAIAELSGQTPSALALAPQPRPAVALPPPPGLPAALLLRRPDIAAAERRVAAANARLGVAQAAWLPSLTLSAQGGYRSDRWHDWIDAPHRYWSLGPVLAQTLLDGGLRRARRDEAGADYDAVVADYRGAVLRGIREVEDNLAALQGLAQQAEAQAAAVATAREAERLLLNQYRAGTADYLAVVVAQTTALASEQQALQILDRRLAASVGLVKALGGGWRAPE